MASDTALGCKLHLLIGSLYDVERAGNILISFNIIILLAKLFPLWNSLILHPMLDMEFAPSPKETEQLIADHYNVRRNLLLKFTQDELDQNG